jgi:hypothetical protein
MSPVRIHTDDKKNLFTLPIRTLLTINEKREKERIPMHHHIDRQKNRFTLSVWASLAINAKKQKK